MENLSSVDGVKEFDTSLERKDALYLIFEREQI